MTWNYRIVKLTNPENGKVGYAIHEAYYNDSGEIHNITQEAIAAFGETPEELITDLENMLEDAKAQPVLDGDNITFAKMDD